MLGITAQFFALFGLFYVNAQYLQDVKGTSTLLSGVCVLPLAITMPYAGARSTRLAVRVGGRATVMLGLLTLTAALALLSCATAATPYPLYGLPPSARICRPACATPLPAAPPSGCAPEPRCSCSRPP